MIPPRMSSGLPRCRACRATPAVRSLPSPWEAQAFALAVKLSEEGHFTWNEWAATLGAELKAAAERDEPDDGSRYYHHWLATLERLVAEKGLADPAALAARKEASADAYRRTHALRRQRRDGRAQPPPRDGRVARRADGGPSRFDCCVTRSRD